MSVLSRRFPPAATPQTLRGDRELLSRFGRRGIARIDPVQKRIHSPAEKRLSTQGTRAMINGQSSLQIWTLAGRWPNLDGLGGSKRVGINSLRRIRED